MRRILATAALAALAAAGLAAAPATMAHAAVAVTNPGFGANGATTSPTGWSTYSSNGTASASYSEKTATSHDGDGYQLTHWSSSAYSVTTYQYLPSVPDGYYTLGVWVRSNGGDTSDYIALTSCGGGNTATNVPVDSDGNWVHIVTYVDVTSGQCTINFVTSGNAGDWTNFDGVTFTAGSAPLAIRGGDVSSLYRSEQDGGAYDTSSGTKENADAQLSAAGMNYVRLRVWVNPQDGFDNEAQLLAMAKQAAGYGQQLLLDFHYSDTWADPGHQATPAAWSSDTLSQLETQVYNYSRQVVSDLVAQGTPPAMVQVGNEINAGMLWPDGSTSNWPQLAALLKEGIAGVRAADSSAKIVLHLAGSDSESTLASWYSTAISDGVSFDIIGLSYYDYWDGRLDVLQTDLDGLAAKYGKQVAIAETAYPDRKSTRLNSSHRR